MNWKNALAYLSLAFGIAWFVTALTFALGLVYGTLLSKITTAFFVMLAPAATVVILERKDLRGLVHRYGLDFAGFHWRGLLSVLVVAIGFIFCILIWIYFLGNVLKVEGFGRVLLTQEELLNRIQEMLRGANSKTQLPDDALPIGVFPLLIVGTFLGVVFGGIFNIGFTLGEELGWRGRLQNNLQHLGFWRSNLLIGVIWGLWHAPLIVQGHNYPDHPFVGIGMMALFCIPLSFLMHYARYAVRSIWGAAALHGSINGSAGIVTLFTKPDNSLLNGVAGVAGMLGGVSVLLVLLVVNRNFLRDAWRIGNVLPTKVGT